MPLSADTLSTKSSLGRNATPLTIMDSVTLTLGGQIHLDVASDALINNQIGALRFFDFIEDGLAQSWESENVWVQPPGDTVIGGTEQERVRYLLLAEGLLKCKQSGAVGEVERLRIRMTQMRKEARMKVVPSSFWLNLAYRYFKAGVFDQAILLLYRGGSFGALDERLLASQKCMTAKVAANPKCVRAGRIVFDTIEHGVRVPQPANTQSSIFFHLYRRSKDARVFEQEFSKYGVVC